MYYNLKKSITVIFAVCISMLMLVSCSEDGQNNNEEVVPEAVSSPEPAATEEPVVSPGRVSDIEASGECGGVNWEFGDDGVLAIYGEGVMDDYEAEGEDKAPWSEFEVKKLYVHSGVTSIGDFAFYQMESLSEADIDVSVTKIGYNAFEGTAWLNAQSLQFVVAGDGVLIKYNGASGDVIIPHGIKYISDAFKESGNPADGGVDITSVNMPDSVTEIGSHAFYGCRYLHDVVFSANIEAIGESAFENSGIRSDIELPAGVYTIGNRAFASCKELYGIKLSENLESIGDFAFADSRINHIEIPANVNAMGKNPFLNCSDITRIEVSAENITFENDENGVLYNEELSELIACPDNFAYSEMIIPDTVVAIKSYAFIGCELLERVLVPTNVEYIGESAFDEGITIKAEVNSKAREYAQENGLVFETALNMPETANDKTITVE